MGEKGTVLDGGGEPERTGVGRREKWLRTPRGEALVKSRPEGAWDGGKKGEETSRKSTRAYFETGANRVHMCNTNSLSVVQLRYAALLFKAKGLDERSGKRWPCSFANWGWDSFTSVSEGLRRLGKRANCDGKTGLV